MTACCVCHSNGAFPPPCDAPGGCGLQPALQLHRQPVDTGHLWKWVDRLTRDRRQRLVRQLPGAKPRVEYVQVPSLFTQLREAVASSNSGGGRDKSSTGSRSPLDLAALALIRDMETTATRALAAYGSPVRVTAGAGDVVTFDLPAELRHLAATVVSVCDLEVIDFWADQFRTWVSRTETTLTTDDEQVDMRGVRGHACPTCRTLWVTTRQRSDTTASGWETMRDPALVIAFREGQVLHITCRACGGGWWRGEDVALLTDQIAMNTAVYGDASLWGETVPKTGRMPA